MPFFHPPIMRPTSSSNFESSIYFSFWMHLFSHASCRKNLTPSSLDVAIVSLEIFCSGGRYREMKIYSRSSRKYPSIFPPRFKRNGFGESTNILNQNEYDTFAFCSTEGAAGGGGTILTYM